MKGALSNNIIIGLGNYVFPKTRHSIGMVVCNALASHYDLTWEYKRKYKAYTACIVSPSQQHFYLMKSSLPMNINGKSLLKAVRDLNVSMEDIFILHDDLERSLGKFSWKMEGSAGGHNGMKSVIASMGSHKMKRVRIGIGRPVHKDLVTDYVLSPFHHYEEVKVEMVVDKIVDMLVNDIIDEVIEVDEDELASISVETNMVLLTSAGMVPSTSENKAKAEVSENETTETNMVTTTNMVPNTSGNTEAEVVIESDQNDETLIESETEIKGPTNNTHKLNE